jgi:uncharacterized membrane protein HdeD (DUF308 family)
MSARPATGDSGLDPLPEQDPSFGPRGAGRLVARVGTSALRLGVVLAILGALALIAPWGAATAVDIACGVALATAGIAQIMLSATAFDWRGFWLSLVCGAISLMAGTAMLAIPRTGIEAIVVFVGLAFLFEAAAKLAAAWALRDAYPWVWLLSDGLLTAVLGSILVTASPEDAGTLLGALIGINLLSSGVTFAFTGWSLRQRVTAGP